MLGVQTHIHQGMCCFSVHLCFTFDLAAGLNCTTQELLLCVQNQTCTRIKSPYTYADTNIWVGGDRLMRTLKKFT